MKLCRYQLAQSAPRIGLVSDDRTILDLSSAGIQQMTPLLESGNLMETLAKLSHQALPGHPLADVRVLSPVEKQEVWAAGVTYLRSKKARMEESVSSASAYDRVYDAERPEIFFKSLPEKVVSPGEPVGIRKDARWNVPEPELALVINSRRQIIGCTIGNDMSSRDIEGENVLYLPQAKIYDRSCALGPFVTVGASETDARGWAITLEIQRNGEIAFQGQTSVGQIKRSFQELVDFLFRSQSFPHGAVLLTGTGVVPPDSFTLQEKDHVKIDISGIGTLACPVVAV
jgi:2-dehydro-3-deoxy-D-arabinonate dehydratase